MPNKADKSDLAGLSTGKLLISLLSNKKETFGNVLSSCQVVASQVHVGEL